ncbi:Centromere/kinetochore protein zw10 [Guillardia theta CCMP2712]|uniref:Centromere/kinetochore protein zw10 n=1 Tax=Guillardia theta (strain CCMP2712) TaxID=905079 RepID=L1JZS5_GUITC|nr:Centromere/kinetochore protein zw10 [Guillardia theta CCMP2712]EKX54111.1 Centromere/kinetochore protein zw10 [Guillardia theta CCMP2712]|eukprot:XP_005841091.1 Centromere/kinetochore protein zw10 [Guillardia theta CCMP2712]
MVVDGSMELLLSAAREIAKQAESNGLGLDLKLKTCRADELPSVVVADLAAIEGKLKEANESLESFVETHDKEMMEYRKIASGIIAENSTLAFEHLAAAEGALTELENKKQEAQAIAEELKKEEEKHKWLERILSIYTFCETFQAELEEGRDDAKSLRSLAVELLGVKTYLDGLPRLQGKTPNVVKVVNPVLREIAKKLRAVLRAYIANNVVFDKSEMRMCHGGLPNEALLSLKKKELVPILLKAGSGICFAIDALEMLDAYEDESGGRVTKVGGGREQFELVLQGLENFFSPVFEGKGAISVESEIMKESGGKGEGSEEVKDVRSKFVESEMALQFALTFVFDVGLLDSKQAFKQDWQKLAAERMWMLFESKLSSNLMFGFPVESGNFKKHFELVQSCSRDFMQHVKANKKGSIQGLDSIDPSVFDRTISSVPELFIKKRQLAHVEQTRANLKNRLCQTHDLVASMRVLGQPCKEDLEASKKKAEILREAHEACSSEVTKNQEGGEYVPGLAQALLQTSRDVVELYLAITEQLFSEKVEQLDILAVGFHNDAMYIANAIALLQVIATLPSWRTVLSKTGNGCQVADLSFFDLIWKIRAQAAKYLDKIATKQFKMIECELFETEKLFRSLDDEVLQHLQTSCERIKHQISSLSLSVLWPGSPDAQPALPVGLYRRVVGCILNHYYNALLRFVLSIQDIAQDKVQELQEVLTAAKVDHLLKVRRAFVPSQPKFSMLLDLLGMTVEEFLNLVESEALTMFRNVEVEALVVSLFPQSEKRQQIIRLLS